MHKAKPCLSVHHSATPAEIFVAAMWAISVIQARPLEETTFECHLSQHYHRHTYELAFEGKLVTALKREFINYKN